MPEIASEGIHETDVTDDSMRTTSPPTGPDRSTPERSRGLDALTLRGVRPPAKGAGRCREGGLAPTVIEKVPPFAQRTSAKGAPAMAGRAAQAAPSAPAVQAAP